MILKINEFIIWVSGGCKLGGDVLIFRYCKENGLEIIEYLFDWDKYGKFVGFIRNKFIIDDIDYFILFWDYKFKGIKSFIDLVEKKGILIKIVRVW